MIEGYRFAIFAVCATIISVGGVVFAVFVTQCADDGGRGGSITVALSFLFLFIGRDYATEVFDILREERKSLSERLGLENKKQDVPEETADSSTRTSELKQETEELLRRLTALIGRVNIQNEQQRHLNLALAFTSVFGTVFWGFGDLFASWFIPSNLSPC